MSSVAPKKTAALAVLGALLAAGGYVAGRYAGHGAALPPSSSSPSSLSTSAAAPANAPDAKIDPDTGRKVLYWHDPMVPGQKFDRPGKSPFMDMQLVPAYADEAADDSGVRMSPAMQQNLGIRYATVRRADVGQTLTVVGSTQFDESLADVVQSRVNGYIDKLHARTPMQRIQRGAPVATLFVPDWLAPQEEYLALRRGGDSELVEAARQRMRALSIPDSVIAQLEQSGRPQRQLTLYAPASGVITELPLREGAMVAPGMTVAKVSGLGKLWLLAEVPEMLAPAVRPGMKASAQFAGRPGRSYTGVVRDILPQVSTGTRTVQARLELDNRDASLTPGLLMQVKLTEATPVSRLLVPTEAVLHTGRRSVVLVVGENRRIRPLTVSTGREHGDDTEILDGLSEGQQVVVSGQFLIDSEASLKSALAKFADPATPPAASPASPLHHATGRIEQVTPEALTLTHDPVPALKWGTMTMDFAKPSPEAFRQFKRGDRVHFTFRETDDGYLLDSVEPAGGKP